MQKSQKNQSFYFINNKDKLEKIRENFIKFVQQICPQLNISYFNKLGVVGERSLSKVYVTQRINISKVYAAERFILKNLHFFYNQLNISRQISHPNIQKCIGYSSYDCNIKSNTTTITEYCYNSSLKDILDQEKKM